MNRLNRLSSFLPGSLALAINTTGRREVLASEFLPPLVFRKQHDVPLLGIVQWLRSVLFGGCLNHMAGHRWQRYWWHHLHP